MKFLIKNSDAEFQNFYDGKKISNAALAAELLISIRLHEKAQEEFYSIYLNTPRTKSQALRICLILTYTYYTICTNPLLPPSGEHPSSLNAGCVAAVDPSDSAFDMMADDPFYNVRTDTCFTHAGAYGEQVHL